MSKGGAKTHTATTGTRYDPRVTGQWDQLYQDATNQQFDPYSGNRVAGLTPDQIAAQDMARQNVNLGMGTTQAGIGHLEGAAGYQPINVAPVNAATPGGLEDFMRRAGGGVGAQMTDAERSDVAQTSTPRVAQDASLLGQTVRGQVRDINAQTGAQGMGAYQNPYESQVVDQATQDLNRSRQLVQGQSADAAAAAGAFGGSRHGVVDAGINRDYFKAVGDMAGGLRHRGFETAAGLGQTDADRMLSAQGANQGVDLSAASQGLGTAGNIGMSNTSQANAVNMANADRALQSQIANQGAGLQAQGIQTSRMNLGLGAAGIMADLNKFNAGQGLAAQGMNQGAGLEGNQQRLMGGNALVGAGATQQGMGQSAADFMNQFGTQQQATEQRGLDARYDDYRNQQDWQQQQIGNRTGILGSTPIGSTTTETQPVYRQSPWATLAGLGGTILGGPIGGMVGSAVGGLLKKKEPVNPFAR